MRPIRSIIRVLPIRQDLQHPLGIKGAPWDGVRDQELRLRQRQGSSVFFKRFCTRTRKASASITSVI